MGSQRSNARGAAGGRRDTQRKSAKQRTRRELRDQDPRVIAAREEVAEAEAQLERLNRELANAGPPEGAAYQAKQREALAAKGAVIEREQALANLEATPVKIKKASTKLPIEGDGGKGWTLGQARTMLMQGYTLEHVVCTTGYGTKHFNDIPLRDGRGVSREEWLEAIEQRDRRAQVLEKVIS